MKRFITAGIFGLLGIAPIAAAQPANDSCDLPELIAGFSTFGFSTVDATVDGFGHPACLFSGTNQVNRDVWYCWTADLGSSGPVVLETCAPLTGLDTKVAIYEGCSPCPEAGGLVACNDDSCGLQTRVSWSAVAGQSYMIRFGQFSETAAGAVGSFRIASALPTVLAGPFTNPLNNRDYYLLNPASWTFSQAAAVAMGGNLATVRDLDENEFLREQVLGFDGADRRGWIGLNDVAQETSFVWASGEPVVFTYWSSGEPNNNPAPENFVEMFGSNGLWNDANETAATVRWGLVEIGGGTPVCRPDWNDDGTVNSSDISSFLTGWLASVTAPNLDADYNEDGMTNSSDISAFLTGWLDAVVNGC